VPPFLGPARVKNDRFTHDLELQSWLTHFDTAAYEKEVAEINKRAGLSDGGAGVRSLVKVSQLQLLSSWFNSRPDLASDLPSATSDGSWVPSFSFSPISSSGSFAFCIRLFMTLPNPSKRKAAIYSV
jgi:hypothetical protein